MRPGQSANETIPRNPEGRGGPADAKLKVYYDGLCVVCGAEIAHYRRRDRDGRIVFVDISAPGFSAESEGLDPSRVRQVFHARRPDGGLLTGVDAFVEIWRTIPGYGALRWLAESRAFRPWLDLGYAGFARIRPLLPRRKGLACETGICAR